MRRRLRQHLPLLRPHRQPLPRPLRPPPAPPVETPAASAPPAPSVVPPAAPTPQDLKESIRQGSSLAEGKTLSYFSAMKQQAQEAAAPPQPGAPAQPASNPVQTAQEAPLQPGPAISTPEDPAVGWLVCIGGAHLCETFPISVGLNSIGRGPGNKIVLGKDQSVSREKHAYLTFEPVKKHFFLRPGDSSGLTYLNDDYIYETKTIQAGDIIALGQSRFYFQPLCGENFSWDEYL